MKCTVHTDADATGYCRNCGRPLCPECTRDVRGALYCENCLGNLLAAPPPAGQTHSAHGAKPGVALGLGFIPGLGAVYNGEYIKALIHVLIFGGLIAAQSNAASGGGHAFLGVVLGCFYLYMPIEAYHTAKSRQQSGGAAGVYEPGESVGTSDSGTAFLERHHTPSGAIILIALGVFLLFANLGWFQWDWFSKAWPAALIVLGAWMLFERLRKS
jgi:hypothetical protein